MTAPQEVRQPTRVWASLGSTAQTGEFEFSKMTIGLERDVAPLETPLDACRDIHTLLKQALEEMRAAPMKPKFSVEKILESLPWAPGKTAGREWIRIKDHAELKQTLALIQEKAVNGYYTIGRHVYRIEGDFLGRYPKREGGKT
jgi:hypothetical protein